MFLVFLLLVMVMALAVTLILFFAPAPAPFVQEAPPGLGTPGKWSLEGLWSLGEDVQQPGQCVLLALSDCLTVWLLSGRQSDCLTV